MPRYKLPPGKGRPKGSKNKETEFKLMWKAGLAKAVQEAGGAEKFIKEWIATRQGKHGLNEHMLRVCQPTNDKVDVNVSGNITVKKVYYGGNPDK